MTIKPSACMCCVHSSRGCTDSHLTARLPFDMWVQCCGRELLVAVLDFHTMLVLYT